jgi:hypothetical protein
MYTWYSFLSDCRLTERNKKAQYAAALQITPLKIMSARSICKAAFDITNKSRTTAHFKSLTLVLTELPTSIHSFFFNIFYHETIIKAMQ